MFYRNWQTTHHPLNETSMAVTVEFSPFPLPPTCPVIPPNDFRTLTGVIKNSRNPQRHPSLIFTRFTFVVGVSNRGSLPLVHSCRSAGPGCRLRIHIAGISYVLSSNDHYRHRTYLSCIVGNVMHWLLPP